MPEPWQEQLDELAAVYQTQIALATALQVCTSSVQRWQAGYPPCTRERIKIGNLHGRARPAFVVVQQAALVRQCLDAVLEMGTLAECHAEARRVLDLLRRGITPGPAGRPLWPPPPPVRLVTVD